MPEQHSHDDFQSLLVRVTNILPLITWIARIGIALSAGAVIVAVVALGALPF